MPFTEDLSKGEFFLRFNFLNDLFTFASCLLFVLLSADSFDTNGDGTFFSDFESGDKLRSGNLNNYHDNLFIIIFKKQLIESKI